MHASWENTTINVSKTAQLIPGYNLAVLDYGREYYGLNDTLAAHGQRKLEREAKKMSSEPAKATTNMWLFTGIGEALSADVCGRWKVPEE